MSLVRARSIRSSPQRALQHTRILNTQSHSLSQSNGRGFHSSAAKYTELRVSKKTEKLLQERARKEEAKRRRDKELEGRIKNLEGTDFLDLDVLFSKHYPQVNWPRIKKLIEERDQLFEEHKKEAAHFDPVNIARRERAYNEETEDIIRMHADLVLRKREAAANRVLPSVLEVRTSRLLHGLKLWEGELTRSVITDKVQDAIREMKNLNARKPAAELEELLQDVVVDYNKRLATDQYANQVKETVQQFRQKVQPLLQRFERIKEEDSKETEDLLEFGEELGHEQNHTTTTTTSTNTNSTASSNTATQDALDELESLEKQFSQSLENDATLVAGGETESVMKVHARAPNPRPPMVDLGYDVEYAASRDEKVTRLQEQIARDRELYDRFRYNRIHQFYQKEQQELNLFLNQFTQDSEEIHSLAVRFGLYDIVRQNGGHLNMFRAVPNTRLGHTARALIHDAHNPGRNEFLTKIENEANRNLFKHVYPKLSDEAVREAKKELIITLDASLGEVHHEDEFGMGWGALPTIYDPLKIEFSRKNINSFVNVSATHVGTVFAEGLPKELKEDMKYNHHDKRLGFMVRREVVDIIDALKHAQNNNFLASQKAVPWVLVGGDPGSGRSSVLAQLTLWARTNGWLVVYIPSGSDFVTHKSGLYITESKIKKSMWDQPDLGLHLCEALLKVHGPQFAQIPLKTEFEIGNLSTPFRRVPNKTTLKDLLHFAVINEDFACDAIYYLRKELSLVTEFPVMIAVDGINYFYDPTQSFGDPHSPKQWRLDRLHPKKMTIPSSFLHLKNHGLVNGLVVGALSGPERVCSTFLKENHIEPNNPRYVSMTSYTDEEHQALMNYHNANGTFKSVITGGTSTYIYNLTGGNAKELNRYISVV